MEKLVRYSFVFATAAFFAVMWGLLLRSRLTIAPASRLQPDYNRLLKPGENKRSTRWTVHLAGERIGECDMSVERQESGTIGLRANTRITLNAVMAKVLRVRQPTFGRGALDIEFRASFSPLRGLQHFWANSTALNSRLEGMVVKDEMIVRGHIGEDTFTTRVPYDESRLLSQVLSPLVALPELDEHAIGTSWTADMVNPVAGTVQEVVVTVLRSKELMLGHEKVKAFQLVFAAGNSRWGSWVTEGGDVLVQGTPFGLTLQRADLSAAALAGLPVSSKALSTQPQ